METKTDGAGKTAEEAQQTQTESYKGSLDQGSFDKVWSANRANEAKAKELEAKLQKFENDKAQVDKSREEAVLKAKGDYEGLTKLKQAEYDNLINSVKSDRLSLYLQKTADKYGMNDPADADRFIGEIDADEKGNPSNPKDVEKLFEALKKSKPYLFSTEKKPVPKTDNLPFKTPDGSDTSGMSRETKLALGTQAIIDQYKRRTAVQ